MQRLLSYFTQLFRTALSEDPSFTIMHSTSSISVDEYIITISIDKKQGLKRSHEKEEHCRQVTPKMHDVAMNPQYVRDANLYNTFGHGF